MSIVSKFLGPWIIKDAWWGEVIWAMPERKRFFFCEVFPQSANQIEFVFRKDLLDMTLANGDERSSWPMR